MQDYNFHEITLGFLSPSAVYLGFHLEWSMGYEAHGQCASGTIPEAITFLPNNYTSSKTVLVAFDIAFLTQFPSP